MNKKSFLFRIQTSGSRDDYTTDVWVPAADEEEAWSKLPDFLKQEASIDLRIVTTIDLLEAEENDGL